MEDFVWISPLWIPIVAIIGGITLAIVKSISGARVRELEVRERIAMIEKGLIPPPETDPRGFDRAMGVADRMERRDRFEHRYERWSSRSPERHRSSWQPASLSILTEALWPSHRSTATSAGCIWPRGGSS